MVVKDPVEELKNLINALQNGNYEPPTLIKGGALEMPIDEWAVKNDDGTFTHYFKYADGRVETMNVRYRL